MEVSPQLRKQGRAAANRVGRLTAKPEVRVDAAKAVYVGDVLLYGVQLTIDHAFDCLRGSRPRSGSVPAGEVERDGGDDIAGALQMAHVDLRHGVARRVQDVI